MLTPPPSAPTLATTMKTALRPLLGVDFPLLAFSHCRDVVAAVSRAGGVGVFGAAGCTPEHRAS